MISDELLEFYGDMFVGLDFKDLTFEQFLVDPNYRLDKMILSIVNR